MGAIEGCLIAIMGILAVYTVRHTVFALNRLFGRQRYPYLGFGRMSWPTVTILVPAHNEEVVISGSLQALLGLDYPSDRYVIMPLNDRSTDRTREIIDGVARRHPGRIRPLHRDEGKPGKAAALKDACTRPGLIESELLIVFDADYLPVPGLLKSLVVPFSDPEVGAVMGRVVPMNVSRNALTRMLDLERSGGYQVDQQARMNLGLIPQYGGTVGGVRRSALEAIGGWDDNCLAEDTDVTFRLYLSGWSVVYQNASECYEEVPETWGVRRRQIRRWAKGHNSVFLRQAVQVLRCRDLPLWKRLDGVLLLAIYMIAPLTLLGWLLAVFLYYTNGSRLALTALGFFSVIGFSSLGNFALFFEVGAAAHLDGYRQRIRLLPFGIVFFLVSQIAVTRAILVQLFVDIPARRRLRWDKTARFRKASS
jgi:cellulose synthase/poly-beta-1,6-N-acetylglucosamine synthase-like glycosyltransferase